MLAGPAAISVALPEKVVLLVVEEVAGVEEVEEEVALVAEGVVDSEVVDQIDLGTFSVSNIVLCYNYAAVQARSFRWTGSALLMKK